MNKIKDLLEVRKLISLLVALTFVVLAVTKQLDAKLVEYVIITVITFYFAKQTALDTPSEQKTTEAIKTEMMNEINNQGL